MSALRRPAFPAQWSVLHIPLDELTLAHTLPVGQTFLWHRQRIPLRDVKPVPTDPAVKLEQCEVPDLPPTEPTEEWSRALRNPERILLLRQTPQMIYYTSITPSAPAPPNLPQIDRTYLLDLFNARVTAAHGSLGEMYARWAAQDPALFGRAWSAGHVPRGVRVLRQDPWECLVSFITSSANNVPRITSLLQRLCCEFSPLLAELPPPGVEEPTDTGEEAEEVRAYTGYHVFPRPIDLLRASPAGTEDVIPRLQQTLRDLGFGYRAAFIASSLETLVSAHGTREERALIGSNGEGEGVEQFLSGLRNGENWRTQLLNLKGVGRKVADCIGLMSLDRANVVPIDTHLQQIAARHPRFPGKLRNKATSSEGVYIAVQGFLSGLWGGGAEEGAGAGWEGAGWCQSVMFAADLKGSTAVVGVKVETQVETKLEAAVGASAVAGDVKLEGTKRRRARTVESKPEDTVSVVSELVRVEPVDKQTEDESGAQSAVVSGSTGRKRKREQGTGSTVVTTKRTMTKKTVTTTTTTKAKTAHSRISSMMTSAKSSAYPADQAGQGAQFVKRTTGRSERYAARCDLLEVAGSMGAGEG